MLIVSLLSLSPVAGPQPDTIVATPRRVTAESWRDVACAQVRAGAFAPSSDPGSEAESLTVTMAGEQVTLTLDGDSLWVYRPGADAPRALPVDLASSLFVSLDSLDLPFEVLLYEDGGERRATVMTHYHLESTIEIDGEPVRLVIYDMDLDGQVSAGDQWVALEGRLLEAPRLAGLYFSSVTMDEPWYFGDRVLTHSAFPDPAADGPVTLTLAPATQPRSEFLAARAARRASETFALFDATRDAFLEQFGIDPDRPRDPNPPRWYHARDLDEALAVARLTGRPLLVEFGSVGCPWCMRYAWLNYADLEVNERLRRFTCVKIDMDLDPDLTSERLDLDGVPWHVLFDLDGEVLHKSNGWRAPRHHVELLDEMLELVGGTER